MNDVAGSLQPLTIVRWFATNLAMQTSGGYFTPRIATPPLPSRYHACLTLMEDLGPWA